MFVFAYSESKLRFIFKWLSRFEVFPVGASTSLLQIMHSDVLLSFVVKCKAHGLLGDWRSAMFSVLMWFSLSKEYQIRTLQFSS